MNQNYSLTSDTLLLLNINESPDVLDVVHSILAKTDQPLCMIPGTEVVLNVNELPNKSQAARRMIPIYSTAYGTIINIGKLIPTILMLIQIPPCQTV
jgi:hypothetical protein